MTVVEIDGSFGEGGGQILRTSLASSLITRTAVRIYNIRARRAKPGLRRQHLTAVRAAAKIGSARVAGDAVGSSEIVFTPGQAQSGAYLFDVGSAGSTTLVFQTVLPVLLLCSGSSSITFIGGTHDPGGPPWHFIETVFLPILRRMGAGVRTQLETYGFAPVGGGKWQAEILPSRLRPLKLSDRGEMRERSVRALVSQLPVSIAERELGMVRAALKWPESAYEAGTVPSPGPGNVIMIAAQFDGASELSTGFGQKGVAAENVAAHALDCWERFDRAGVPVGEHLADQLLLPLAIAGGGSIRTTEPTLHTTTNAEVISRFLPIRFRMSPLGGEAWEIVAEST